MLSGMLGVRAAGVAAQKDGGAGVGAGPLGEAVRISSRWTMYRSTLSSHRFTDIANRVIFFFPFDVRACRLSKAAPSDSLLIASGTTNRSRWRSCSSLSTDVLCTASLLRMGLRLLLLTRRASDLCVHFRANGRWTARTDFRTAPSSTADSDFSDCASSLLVRGESN